MAAQAAPTPRAEPPALRGALVGCGYVAHFHLTAWSRIRGAKIVALADQDVRRAQGRAAEFHIPGVYTDYRQMLEREQVDFVDIATPPGTHLDMTRVAAAAGLHVLCQKPIAPSLAELAEMSAACAAAGVTFMVNENGRFQPWYREMKALLAAGAIGRPFYANLTSRARLTLPRLDAEEQTDLFRDMPRLIVYELGVHFLDTLRYLFGEPASLYARTQRVSPQVAGEDAASIVLQFGGLTAVIDMSWAALPTWEADNAVTWGEARIEGEAGTLHLQPPGLLRLIGDAGERQLPFPAEGELLGFQGAQQHFVDCVRTGAPPETSGSETLKTMELVFGAYLSAQENRVYHVGRDRERLA